MKRAAVQISEMRLRVQGIGPQQARHLAEMVARRLADLPLVKDRSREIDAVVVRTRSDGTSSLERMADQIATRVRADLD